MTIYDGQQAVLKIGNGVTPTETFTAIGGIRVKNFKVSNKAADNSNLSSGRWRSIVDGQGITKLTISADGTFTNSVSEETLRSKAFSASTNNYKLVLGNGSIISGSFVIAEYERNSEFSKGEEFRVVLESAGVVVYS